MSWQGHVSCQEGISIEGALGVDSVIPSQKPFAAIKEDVGLDGLENWRRCPTDASKCGKRKRGK